ncbi:Gfo/Idh/MocA family oxidoreductase [Paraflavitalea sp. CAU 1676]|uniref:Gfo/Idh/MocA family protein n=1 Tax=Paraflavitalea sp. CAU 1676 TaxID=3032598 RepID=UPI0023DA741F|nr:Gfo/Idh/MocA family oxidoreductase [Paraflavitalea sp. CAU 1676]MDF2192960.1 Gfo/Idh/MocA family oxidoreductase [Paraflavitalea sp. CAU 1676]
MRTLILFLLAFGAARSVAQPLKVAVAGISHGHSTWILGYKNKADIQVTGVWEKDTALANKAAKRYGLPAGIFYTDLGKMLDVVKPEAVVAFGSIYDHLQVVEACAPRGIHVMVEKPLAVSVAHARKMDSLARKYNIHLLTNYETSWYPSVAKTFQLALDSNYTGRIRKAVIHDGHQGPKEIGCSPEFLAWLTDPVLNGAGALVDFGCYGANLMTHLMNGQQPFAVTAVTRQYKPQLYPKVDDDATIIVDYPEANCIIQASWNWPYNRKDMEVYGDKGYIFAPDSKSLVLRQGNTVTQRQVTSQDVPVYEDPFRYLADVVHGKIQVKPEGLYALPNNLTVVKILEAAKESARTGKKVVLR